MDIIAASNIGMTNAYKDRKKTNKKRIKHNKLYVLAKIKYTINGVLGNNTIDITMCNNKALIEMAKDYFVARGLRRNRKWEELDVNKLKTKDAIEILTKREYAMIQEIDEDIIGKSLSKNKIVDLISVDDFKFSNKGI